ncbi:polyprenyl glycosylphosphotransferase [Microbacterium mangrovi]|uniref:Polyprenyl glycosylphosphotransferase n=1 Tax=Microbacterium mangrovi TaxID=1348253 RepID=A0A0B2ACH7_9MICO|nr:polyprenyl glycosylphosphotransferase [Microbacterium mangrovi]
MGHALVSQPHNWRVRYATRVWVTDLALLVAVVFGTQILWLGLEPADVATRESNFVSPFSYWAFSIGLVSLWMLALALVDSRSDRVMGTGSAEYVRIIRSSLNLFGMIAIVAFLVRIDVARGYLLISLPLGIVLLLTGRRAWRGWLVAQRRAGNYSARVLLVGSVASVTQLAHEFGRAPSAGYTVVGACLAGGPRAGALGEDCDIPVVGDLDAIKASLSATGADTVAVTSTGDLTPQQLKQLSWDLEPGKQHLVLAPTLIDIAGPRIHTRPVAGLPLIHVETPRFTRGQRFLKRSFDVVGSAVLLLIASPVLIALAIAVKVSSTGPAFYVQSRIGQHGKPFGMIKFRSMRVGADAELAALLAAQGTSETPLFKVKDDPRITPIGKFIRKYSLDELPQLLNVLGGSMSLVGPRPQIAAEVALYTDAARRRLLTRPGITGLWQVSGRSALDWDDAVRLDLYYVENWSLAGDLTILAKTFNAVVSPGETAH